MITVHEDIVDRIGLAKEEIWKLWKDPYWREILISEYGMKNTNERVCFGDYNPGDIISLDNGQAGKVITVDKYKTPVWIVSINYQPGICNWDKASGIEKQASEYGWFIPTVKQFMEFDVNHKVFAVTNSCTWTSTPSLVENHMMAFQFGSNEYPTSCDFAKYLNINTFFFMKL